MGIQTGPNCLKKTGQTPGIAAWMFPIHPHLLSVTSPKRTNKASHKQQNLLGHMFSLHSTMLSITCWAMFAIFPLDSAKKNCLGSPPPQKIKHTQRIWKFGGKRWHLPIVGFESSSPGCLLATSSKFVVKVVVDGKIIIHMNILYNFLCENWKKTRL